MSLAASLPSPASQKPRLGFLGLGWIGRSRFESLNRLGAFSSYSVADADRNRCREALEQVTGGIENTFQQMLDDSEIDGIVIATPSGLHARQAIAVLQAGKAVFCQKPLGRNAEETREAIAQARRSDRLLAVDFCYRCVAGMEEAKRLVQSGAIGEVYAAELSFHNAYSPDSQWASDRELSGGGCLIDLGIHLLDLAFWMLDSDDVEVHASALGRNGLLRLPNDEVEDYASALLTVGGSAAISLNCSWNLHAGCDALIAAKFYGTRGGVGLRNVNGSFYDFIVERYEGSASIRLAEPSLDWGDRAIARWAARLSESGTYDPEIEGLIAVSQALDQIYSASREAAAVKR